jgi:hypothetical protein
MSDTKDLRDLALEKLKADLDRLRRWQAEALQLLTDATIAPAEWLKRRDRLVIEARTGK